MYKFKRNTLASICLAALVWPMLASANHIESVNGDLSGDYLNPTPVALVPNGTTTVSGTVEGAGNAVTVDKDYFTVTVPVGQVLLSLVVGNGTSGGGNLGSFIGLYPGATGSNPAPPDSTKLLGYYLYSAADIGTDILPKLGTFIFGTNPSIGFIPPLPAGDYTFWIQEGAKGVFPYNFELTLTVPEPATLSLLGLGLAGIGFARRRSA